MTIRIYAHQVKGIACDEVVDAYVFCCWSELREWLNNPKLVPHKCPSCEAESKETK